MILGNAFRAAIIGTAMVGGMGLAHAGPTATVNGVTFPVGILAGGNQVDSSIISEELVTAAGQISSGVGVVTSIDTPALSQVWGNGQNNVELAFVFTNYLATSVVAPTATTAGSLAFTGGTLSFYTLPANTPINGLGSTAADIAAVQAGTLWLSLTAVPEDAAGHTLISTIPAGNSLTNFLGGQGEGFLDVTGGPAGPDLATKTFANAFDTTGFSDLTFTTDFSSSSTNGSDFNVSGSGTLKANAVPEPLSLSILGLGLVALGAARRRRS
jgi:hypothetical protein